MKRIKSPGKGLVYAVCCVLTSLGYLQCALSLQANAQDQIEVQIQPQTVLQKIDESIYSQFLEHIYNSCNGGLWGELVWNRSLEAVQVDGWTLQDGVLKQGTTRTDRRFLLGVDQDGSAEWTDYDIRVIAKKVSGDEGFLVLFRAAPDMSSYYWLNLGGWGNKFVAIEKETPRSNGRHVIGGQKEIPPIEDGETYDIRVVVVGQNIKVFVNQEMIHEIVDFDDDAPKKGCVGVGTWATKAEFGQVLVRDLRRQTLYDMNANPPKTPNSCTVRYWNLEGDPQSRTEDARNSSRYLRYDKSGALAQSDYALTKGESYDYSFWTRGQGVVKATIKNDDDVVVEICSQNVKTEQWQKISGVFPCNFDANNATLALTFEPAEGKYIDVDQISVFPQSWKEQTKGLRPDLMQAIKNLRPVYIRWPGGCYASAYRWKSGIGPQDDRVAYPLELWNDVDVNSFGIDEFMALCEQVGAEPIMVVNIGTEQWIRAVGDNSLRNNDWLQEVCDWVEYCNGSQETTWGKMRAQNGHPEPYNVKMWEIDNEVHPVSTPAQKYVDTLNELVPRMKAIDPNISVIACGSWTGNAMAWDSAVASGAGKQFSFLSTHRYDDPNGFATNPWSNQRFFEAHRDLFANCPNPDIKLFQSEWNAQSTDWRTGLHCGGFLNCSERVGDVVGITAPALFLRHKTATGWDNAFINFDQNRWYPAPNYVVYKLWRDAYAPNLVKVVSDAKQLAGNEPVINLVSTKSDDEKTLFVKLVNTTDSDQELTLSVATDFDLAKCNVQATCVTPKLEENEKPDAKLRKRNTLENPNNIVAQDLTIVVKDGKATLVAPSFSAVVVRIER
ncbi:MAG: alpha-L-arabinofuranosidase C-terminal domain-containing protein [Planctomycetia bacterium]|nr:alpha-L-arabinofuranosidase C-terminal domain-containing protein [Planctomycetia bacterium]